MEPYVFKKIFRSFTVQLDVTDAAVVFILNDRTSPGAAVSCRQAHQGELVPESPMRTLVRGVCAQHITSASSEQRLRTWQVYSPVLGAEVHAYTNTCMAYTNTCMALEAQNPDGEIRQLMFNDILMLTHEKK